MAVNRAPTALFPAYATSGSPVDHFTLALTDVSGLTAAHAHASTGDYPSILLAILQKALIAYTALATADKPTMFEIKQIPMSIATSGTYANKQPYRYQVTFYGDIAVATGVASEA